MKRIRSLFCLTLLVLALPVSAQEPHTGAQSNQAKVDTLDNPDLLWLKQGEGLVIGFLSDSQSFLSIGEGATIKTWRTSDGQLLNSFPTVLVSDYRPDMSLDGSKVVIGSLDNSIEVLDSHSGQQVQLIGPADNGPNGIRAVALGSDGQIAVSADWDSKSTRSKIRSWDVHTGTMIRQYGTTAGSQGLACSPDGKYVVAGSFGGEVSIWERESGKSVKSYSTGLMNIYCVRFSPDSKYLAACGDGPGNQDIKVWRTEDWSEAYTLKGHVSPVHDLRFTPGSRFLVSGGDDGLKQWDIQTGKQVYSYILISPTTHVPVSQYPVIIPPDSAILMSSVGGVMLQWQAHWSPASSVAPDNDPATVQMIITPNPTDNSLTVKFITPDGLSSSVHGSITDIQGREVMAISEQILPFGQQQIPLNLIAQPSGQYFCTLYINNNQYTLPFTIQH